VRCDFLIGITLSARCAVSPQGWLQNENFTDQPDL
jgi:hypothetical protein